MVKRVQEQLQQRGYYDGPIDGVYGDDTQTAVQSFQTDAGFEGTGRVDRSTWQRLQTPELFEEGAAQVAQADTDGTEAPAAASAEIPEETVEAAVEAANSASEAETGIARILWPSLALVAALGSLGIGFLVTNRDKGKKTSEDAWGEAPPEQQTTFPDVSDASHSNGYSTHTVASASVPQVPSGPSQTPVSQTTRLSKINIITELINELQSTDPVKRRKAIWELGQRGDSSAVQSLVNQMVDADSKEKSLILAALSEIGIRSLKPMNRALAIALQDDSPEVRKNAIRDLTRIYDLVAQISQMLGHATEDEDAEVRQTAQWALDQLNRIRQTPDVRMSLQSIEASKSTPDYLPGEISN
ncbi:MAG: peptidoglycan-binding protein [Leptolyngbya sp. SIO4C1]|nr:peptidoglycan-binding protein [Leptolyngbya sp. SIO4C1]